jgi:hypothetical protein
LTDIAEQLGGPFSPILMGAADRAIDDAPVRPKGAKRVDHPGALAEDEKRELKFKMKFGMLFNNPTVSGAKNLLDVLGTKGSGAAVETLGKLAANQIPAPIKIGAERLDAFQSTGNVFGEAPKRDATPPDASRFDKLIGPIIRNTPVMRGKLPVRKVKKIIEPRG